MQTSRIADICRFTGFEAPVSSSYSPTRVNNAHENNKLRTIRALTHRVTSRLPTAERHSVFHAIDHGVRRGNSTASLENAVRIAQLARDRLLAASREEQRVYRTLISAEVALRDAGELALDDRVPYRGRESMVSAAPPAGEKDPAAASASQERPVSSRKGENDDAVGLRTVLEQVHAARFYPILPPP